MPDRARAARSDEQKPFGGAVWIGTPAGCPVRCSDRARDHPNPSPDQTLRRHPGNRDGEGSPDKAGPCRDPRRLAWDASADAPVALVRVAFGHVPQAGWRRSGPLWSGQGCKTASELFERRALLRPRRRALRPAEGWVKVPASRFPTFRLPPAQSGRQGRTCNLYGSFCQGGEM